MVFVRFQTKEGYVPEFVHFVGKDLESIQKDAEGKAWKHLGDSRVVTREEVKAFVIELMLLAGIDSVESGTSDSFYLG